ncbi:hypothetical protein AVEN_177186-1 [Araneus ventricosus]|uniref:Uncharacterized protein n=1 Tax=Araneus ventricosus TaxID=182803 RepID=A0A4Y2V882_ARAVE|nr:hypothetical protein AVEN_177186-1 [Araneus ventricosus]
MPNHSLPITSTSGEGKDLKISRLLAFIPNCHDHNIPQPLEESFENIVGKKRVYYSQLTATYPLRPEGKPVYLSPSSPGEGKFENIRTGQHYLYPAIRPPLLQSLKCFGNALGNVAVYHGLPCGLLHWRGGFKMQVVLAAQPLSAAWKEKFLKCHDRPSCPASQGLPSAS